MVQSFLKQYEYIVVGIVALVLVAGASTITYKLIDGYWQSKWDKRELELTQASNKIINETRQREDALRQSVDKLENENAAYKAKYQTVAANADAANGRLLKQINSVLASTSSEVTGIEVSGKTTREAVILLANVLGKSIQRNRELAEFADVTYSVGLLCEKSYDAVTVN